MDDDDEYVTTRLFLDVGVDTGYAIFDDKRCRIFGTFKEDILYHRLVYFQGLHLDEIICEMPVLRGGGLLQSKLQEIMMLVSEAFPKHKRVRPGQWKPWPTPAADIPRMGDVKISKHARDAIRIGIWYTHTQV